MRETSTENEKSKNYEESEEMRETSTENENSKISFTTPTVSNNKEMSEPPIPKSSLSDEMREKTSNQDSSNPKPSKSQPFVDIASIGLRRGKRIKAPFQMLSHPSDIKKRVREKEYGLLLMGCAFLSAIENPIQVGAIEKLVKETYNNFICNAYTTYDDFLEANFDGTQNSNSPLAQIY